jgi:hypothetical protein
MIAVATVRPIISDVVDVLSPTRGPGALVIKNRRGTPLASY